MEERPARPTPPERKSWRTFLIGFRYAFAGVHYVIFSQTNMRVHLLAALLALLAGLFFHISQGDFLILFVVIFGVLTAEAFNTAFEACVDLVSPDFHPLAKIAKDVAAGAVLLQAILAVIIAIIIFVPRLWALFHL